MLQFEFRVLQKQISHVWQFVSLGQPIGSLYLMHACLSACLSVYQHTCMSLCLPVTWAWTLTDSDYIARSLHYIWNCPIIAITKQKQCKTMQKMNVLTMTWKWVYTQKTTAGGIKAGWRGLNRGGGGGGGGYVHFCCTGKLCWGQQRGTKLWLLMLWCPAQCSMHLGLAWFHYLNFNVFI